MTNLARLLETRTEWWLPIAVMTIVMLLSNWKGFRAKKALRHIFYFGLAIVACSSSWNSGFLAGWQKGVARAGTPVDAASPEGRLVPGRMYDRICQGDVDGMTLVAVRDHISGTSRCLFAKPANAEERLVFPRVFEVARDGLSYAGYLRAPSEREALAILGGLKR